MFDISKDHMEILFLVLKIWVSLITKPHKHITPQQRSTQPQYYTIKQLNKYITK